MSLLNQYASSVINFSSQLTTTNFSATQALGSPDGLSSGEGNVWTAFSADGNFETLTGSLRFYGIEFIIKTKC